MIAGCHLQHAHFADGWQRVLYGAALVPVALACSALYLFDPAAGGYPLCPFYAMTGMYCPGCGSLRALHQLFRGDPRAAVSYNVLTIVFLPVAVYVVVSTMLLALRGRGLPRMFVPAGGIWAIGALAMAFWVVRNVPAEPFTWLSP